MGCPMTLDPLSSQMKTVTTLPCACVRKYENLTKSTFSKIFGDVRPKVFEQITCDTSFWSQSFTNNQNYTKHQEIPGKDFEPPSSAITSLLIVTLKVKPKVKS